MHAETIYSMARKVINTTIPLTSGFTHILFNLSAQGYSHVKITYYGGGDEGSIDDVVLIERGGVEEKEDGIHELKGMKTAAVAQELKDLFELKVDKHILESASDWYNGEGGGGTIYISCDDAKYMGEHYVNEIKRSYETLEGQFGD